MKCGYDAEMYVIELEEAMRLYASKIPKPDIYQAKFMIFRSYTHHLATI